MFDSVTKKEPRGPKVRRGAFVALSAGLQVLLGLAILFVADRFRAAVTGNEPIVEVRFLKPASPALPGPPAPPRQPPAVPRHKAEPRREIPKPLAMVQPKTVPPEPPPAPPKEEEMPGPNEGADHGGQTTGGEGGVVGGATGGSPHGSGSGVEEAPTYAAAGYRKPELTERDCLQNAIHVPRDLQGLFSRPFTVKFAIRKDGSPAYFQMVTQASDGRIGDLIWRAVTSCHWRPGADPQGHTASIWVVVPFRFQSG